MCYNKSMSERQKISLTTQNRLIIFGLVLSTLLIMAIAIFATVNIQKNLNDSYQNFGQVISKILAIESVEITKNVSQKEAYNILKTHSDSILKSHHDIIFIEFRDSQGNMVYRAENSKENSTHYHRHHSSISSYLWCQDLTNISRLHLVSEMKMQELTDLRESSIS